MAGRLTPVLSRLLLWSVATIGLVVWAFHAGIESYDREHCGPDATDCDLGVLLRGGPWAVLVLLGMLVVIACVEVRLSRRRRKSTQALGETRS
jgi:hypothetical protein